MLSLLGRYLYSLGITTPERQTCHKVTPLTAHFSISTQRECFSTAGGLRAPGVFLYSAGTYLAGAPASAEGFQALARAGYRTFVDLRSDAEVKPEVQAAAEAAGLQYRRIPITGDQDIHLGTARALDALLDERSNYPVAIACASGNRVGALLAVKAFWLDGVSPEEALALGERAGLTRLEPSVRLLLGLSAPQAPSPPKRLAD